MVRILEGALALEHAGVTVGEVRFTHIERRDAAEPYTIDGRVVLNAELPWGIGAVLVIHSPDGNVNVQRFRQTASLASGTTVSIKASDVW